MTDPYDPEGIIFPGDAANGDQVQADMRDRAAESFEKHGGPQPILVNIRIVAMESGSMATVLGGIFYNLSMAMVHAEKAVGPTPLVGGTNMGTWLMGEGVAHPVGVLTEYFSLEEMEQFVPVMDWTPGAPLPEFPAFIVPPDPQEQE